MQQLFEIYRDKQTNFCVGCLHVEDVTKLSSLNNYAPIFNIIFTHLYTIEESKDLWICSWCIQRIKNTQKLFNNFECAKKIITEINIPSSSSENVAHDNLLSKIHDLKAKSRPYFKTVSDKNDYIYTISPRIYETDIDDAHFDEKFAEEFNFKLKFPRKDDIYFSKYRKVKKYDFKKHKNESKDCFKHKSGRSRKSDATVKNSRKTKPLYLRDEIDNLNSCTTNCKDEIVKKTALTSHNVTSDLEKKLTLTDIDEISIAINDLEVKDENNVRDNKDFLLLERAKMPFTENNSGLIRKNIFANHNTKKCYRCDRIFKSRTSMETLTVRGHENKRRWSECTDCKKRRFNCHHCQKTFENRTIRLKHMEENHNLNDIVKVLQCVYCKREFNKYYDLDNHMKTDHKSKYDCLCPVCSIKFKGLRQVRKHIRTVHHVIPAIKNYHCLLCDKTFSLKKKLKCHQFLHTRKKNYKCDVCASAYVSRNHLDEHKLSKHNVGTHTGDFPLSGVVTAPTLGTGHPGLPAPTETLPLAATNVDM